MKMSLNQQVISINIILILFFLILKLSKMLSVKEREIVRKHSKNFIVKNPNVKKAEIVNHFTKQGIASRTIYNNINTLSTP